MNNKDQLYYVNNETILRNEPNYYNTKYIYNRKTCKTYILNNTEFLLIESLTSSPKILSEISKNFSYLNSSQLTKILENFIKKNIITTNISSSEKTIKNKKLLPSVRYPVPVMTFPSEIDISLTRRCQLNCIHCNMDANINNKNEIEPEQWYSIFDQLEENKAMKITVSGGEPLMYPYINNIIDNLSNRNLLKVLLTNGVAITNEIAEKLAKAEFNVVMSLDGADSKTHDIFRGSNGAFNKTLNALDLLRNFNINVHLTTVLNKKNINQIEQIISIAESKGVKLLNLVLLDTIGRGKNAIDWIISKDEYLQLKESINTRIDNNSLKIEIDNPKKYLADDTTALFCKAGTFGMAIDCDGKVFPCNLCYKNDFNLIGDATESSLLQIWHNDNWNLFRGEINLGNLTVCNKCEKNNKCSLKACRGKSFIEGDVYGRPYGCPEVSDFV
ncbi:radical SAM protein with 4Fe4S-binding SPASM domain [Lacrimispora xylanisolvens]|uniref:Radical SAM protein with 4Fe4S-binding SPASM domain n=1 Tax=Lacrimispora xylanisolvens TaxID=384636 RepID=A0A2S6HSK3_9FIRM|nr:radical SAM protein [Hungatella xylanolytica]PPK80666.1 radical SAM protein with 4Fe4S-binding SPASM domain [Hungatella xylanolytica]